MEKRVTFNERWLPYLLVAPQILVTLIFFFWPSGQMAWQSVLIEDAFGGNTKFVWFDNFIQLFSEGSYWASVRITLVFSALVASIGLAQFRNLHQVQWNLTMAATLLVMLPVVVVFFLAQKAFVEGVTLTGVKG